MRNGIDSAIHKVLEHFRAMQRSARHNEYDNGPSSVPDNLPSGGSRPCRNPVPVAIVRSPIVSRPASHLPIRLNFDRRSANRASSDFLETGFALSRAIGRLLGFRRTFAAATDCTLDRSPRRVQRAAIILAVSMPLLAACGSEVELAAAPPPRPIDWTQVKVADQAVPRILPGVVRPVQRAPLGFEVGGRIETLSVEVGDRFEPGDELGRLDTRTWRLTRNERASEVVQAEATTREAEQDFARQEKLHGKGWASEAILDTARAALDTARGRLETARARLAIAEENLRDTVLYAPYAGLVARRLAEPAQQVTAAQTVFEIQGDGAGFEVDVAVPETLIDHLRPGAVHPVTFPARRDAPAQARVTEIGTHADSAGTFPVTLLLLTPGTGLRAGMTAEVTFTVTGLHSGSEGHGEGGAPVAIPVTAFLSGDGEDSVAFVFKLLDESKDDGPGTLERRTITLGPVTSKQAIVLSGLAPGEIIATRGLPFLRAGQFVTRLGVGPKRYE